MDVQLKRGYLEICVLASMLKDDTYGYKLIKDVSEFIEISESTLYPILRRLESGGFVNVRTEEYNGRLRKYYGITSKGKDKIKDFLEEFKDIMKIYKFIEGEYNDDKE